MNDVPPPEDLRCLLAPDCAKAKDCAYSARFEQCVPKDVYDDIGYVRVGSRAQSYFRKLPQQIADTYGPTALAKYCEEQSRWNCLAPCVQGAFKCTTAERQLDPIVYAQSASMLQSILATVRADKNISKETATTVRTLVILSARASSVVASMVTYAHTSTSFVGAMYRNLADSKDLVADMFDPSILTDAFVEELVFRGSMLVLDKVASKLVDKVADTLEWDSKKKSHCLKILHFIILGTQASLYAAAALARQKGGTPLPESAVQTLATFFSGIVYGALARKYGLQSSMAAHALANVVAFTESLTKNADNIKSTLGLLGAAFLQLGVPRLLNYNPKTASKYMMLIQHAQHYTPLPPAPLMDANADDDDAGVEYHDALDTMDKIFELERAAEKEVNAIMEWQTENALESVYYALVGDEEKTRGKK